MNSDQDIFDYSDEFLSEILEHLIRLKNKSLSNKRIMNFTIS